MFLDRRGQRGEGPVGPLDLPLQRLDGGGEQAVEAECRALFVRECGPLVVKGRAQDFAVSLGPNPFANGFAHRVRRQGTSRVEICGAATVVDGARDGLFERIRLPG